MHRTYTNLSPYININALTPTDQSGFHFRSILKPFRLSFRLANNVTEKVGIDLTREQLLEIRDKIDAALTI